MIGLPGQTEEDLVNDILFFEKMDNPGYTTKENGHGYGLSLAREIIESNDRLSSEREIKDNIFKQILKIKM